MLPKISECAKYFVFDGGLSGDFLDVWGECHVWVVFDPEYGGCFVER